MARRDAFTCDVCGKAKQDVNHWWMLFEGESQTGTYCAVYTWDGDIESFKHLCGQECVIKAVNEWMQKTGGK